MKVCTKHKLRSPCCHCRIAILEKALKFYANKKNYASDDRSLATGNQCYDIVLFDFNRGKKRDYAGARARKALRDATLSGTAAQGQKQ